MERGKNVKNRLLTALLDGNGKARQCEGLLTAGRYRIFLQTLAEKVSVCEICKGRYMDKEMCRGI